MNIPVQPPQGHVVGSVPKMLARAGPIMKRLALMPSPQTMVEVGVSSGLMADHLLKNVPDLEWHGIDPWAPPEKQRQCYIETGDVHAVLSREHTETGMEVALRRLAKYGGRANVHRDWSPEAAEGFAPGSIGLVFLDGDHSLEGVRRDIEAWWPIVRPDGWLGGHDYRNQDKRFRFGVEQAVNEWVLNNGLTLQLDGGLTWWVRKP